MITYLKKYNTVWDIASADMEKEFDSEPVCIKELLKTKGKYHGNKVTNFYDKKVQTLIIFV